MTKSLELPNDQIFLEDKPFERFGFIMQRLHGFWIATNVPFLVIEHSPTGFEWGYGGSGPAELALNILENTLRYLKYVGRIGNAAIKGLRFNLAYAMYHDFLWDYVAKLSREELSISKIEFHTVLNFIECWIDKNPEDFYGNKWDPDNKLAKSL